MVLNIEIDALPPTLCYPGMIGIGIIFKQNRSRFFSFSKDIIKVHVLIKFKFEISKLRRLNGECLRYAR